MSDRRTWGVFGAHGRQLDRFGWVLALSAFSCSVLALIDLDSVGDDLRSELGWLLVTFSVAVTLIFAFRASGVRRRWMLLTNIFIMVVLAAAVVTAMVARFGTLPEVLELARPSFIWIIVAVASPIVVLRRIFQHEKVGRETLFGAVASLLLIAIAFSYIFLYLDRVTDTELFGVAESTSSYMYFSLVTITTLGYGDLSPVTDVGRYLASVEAIVGQVLLVTVVARIVSLMSSSKWQQESEDTSTT